MKYEYLKKWTYKTEKCVEPDCLVLTKLSIHIEIALE